MPLSNRELLARIIKCEAGGEGENGMRAVATVVMNRVTVSTGEYQRIGQGDVRRIIFQDGQFDCAAEVLNWRPNEQSIYTNPPEPIHYEIADWALDGGKLGEVGTSLWYLNPPGECMSTFPYNGSGTFHTDINQHCFYRPTAVYKET